jgi:hypothetical protein
MLESGIPVRSVTMKKSAGTDEKSQPPVSLQGGSLLTNAREMDRSTVQAMSTTTFAHSET